MVMKMNKLSYSIWGIFSNKNKFFLKNLQKKLRKDFGGPIFPLHLTLSSNFKIDHKKLLIKMKLISKVSKEIHLETNNFGFKKNFFQSFFVNIVTNKELIYQKNMIDKFLKPKKTKYFPHISLYYGKISSLKKKKIIKDLGSYKKKLLIKKLYLVQNDEKNLKWKIIKKFNL